VAIGLAANNVFPARVGEFARTWVLAREAKIPVTAALASVVLERDARRHRPDVVPAGRDVASRLSRAGRLG
jgi:hypothetical protein